MALPVRSLNVFTGPCAPLHLLGCTAGEAGCGRPLVTTCYHSSAFQPPTATRLHSSAPQGKCWHSLANVRAQTQKHSAATRCSSSFTPLASSAPPTAAFCSLFPQASACHFWYRLSSPYSTPLPHPSVNITSVTSWCTSSEASRVSTVPIFRLIRSGCCFSEIFPYQRRLRSDYVLTFESRKHTLRFESR